MKTPSQDSDPRAVYFSEKLLGLEDKCNMSHCSEMESSTGWLCYDPGAHDWFIGFKCPRDGRGGRSGSAYHLLIHQALDDARRDGVDIEGTTQARGKKYARYLAVTKPIVPSQTPYVQFGFWFSAHFGMIRERRAPGKTLHPDVWNGARWVTGSDSIADAIKEIREYLSIRGRDAEKWDQKQAETYAAEQGIDLYADNPDAPHGG